MNTREAAAAYLEIAEQSDSEHKYSVECSLIGIGYALLALEQTLREVSGKLPVEDESRPHGLVPPGRMP